MNEVLKIALPSLISAATAFVLIHLAFKRFNAEKWREREFQYYIEAIEVVNGIIKICDELVNGANNDFKLCDEKRKALCSDFNAKRVELGGYVNVGRLLFSSEANTILVNFDNILYGVEVTGDDSRLVAAIRDDGEGALDKLIEMAKLDLHRKSIFNKF